VVEQHNKRGFALVKMVDGSWPQDCVLVNVTKVPLVVEGKQLKAKADLRKWLWDERKTAAIRRKERTWLWSRLVDGKSVVGFAAAVKKDVAERMAQRNPEYQWIEVTS
jgi:hypothetical protein